MAGETDEPSHSEAHIFESRVRFDAPARDATLARELRQAFKRHANKTLLVDASSRDQWTGGQLGEAVSRIACGLSRRARLEPGNIVFMMCEHSDKEIIVALGALLAGLGLYNSNADDGYEEERILCDIVRPHAIATSSKHHNIARRLRQDVPGMQQVPIIWSDNPLRAPDANNNNIDANNNSDEFAGKFYARIIEEDGVLLLDDLVAEQRDEQLLDTIINERIDVDAHNATYLLTSGSTGRPKVVPSSQREIINGMYSMLSATRYGVDGDDAQKLLPMSERSVVAGDLPLDHGAGLNTFFLSLIVGAKMVVLPSYDADTFWQGVHDYRITTSIASTTFGYKLLSRLKEVEAPSSSSNNTAATNGHTKTCKWDIESLEYVACAGSKLAYTDLVAETCARHPRLRVVQTYGCTEIGMLAVLLPSEARTAPLMHSVGHLYPGISALLVERNDGESAASSAKPIARDHALATQARGELHVKSRSLFKGYRCYNVNSEQELRAIHADVYDSRGFYCTGDQVYFDAEQRLHIEGRYKDTLFLAQDWKIMPQELEALIDQHPLVEYSAVVGVPDPQLPGCHAPRAFLKLIARAPFDNNNNNGEEKEYQELVQRFEANDRDYVARHVYEFVAQRVAQPKHLRGGVRIIDKMPTVGLLNKIDRKALRVMQ